MKLVNVTLLIILQIMFALLYEGCESNNCSINKVNGVMIFSNKNIPSDKNFKIKFKKIITLDLNLIGIRNLGYLAIDSYKNIYLFDNGLNEIKKIDQKGNILMTFMRQGDGPGEITDCGTVIVSNDTIIASDYITGKLVKYDTQGNFISQVHKNNIVRLMDFRSCGNDRFIGFTTKYIPSKDFMSVTRNLVLFDNSFNVVKVINKKKYQTEIADQADYSYIETFKVDNIAEKIFISSDSDTEFLIDVYNYDGNLIEKIRKYYSPISYNDSEKKVFSEYAKKYNPDYKFPFKYKKAINCMLLDNSGRLWVQVAIDANMTKYIRFDIFKNGLFLNRIETPFSSIDELFLFLQDDSFYNYNPVLNTLDVYSIF